MIRTRAVRSNRWMDSLSFSSMSNRRVWWRVMLKFVTSISIFFLSEGWRGTAILILMYYYLSLFREILSPTAFLVFYAVHAPPNNCRIKHNAFVPPDQILFHSRSFVSNPAKRRCGTNWPWVRLQMRSVDNYYHGTIREEEAGWKIHSLLPFNQERQSFNLTNVS